MAKCYIHEKAVVANDGVCPRCKACKHTNWWKREGDSVYQCCGCYITNQDPKGEKQVLTSEGKWREEK